MQQWRFLNRKPPKLTIDGYVKDLQTVFVFNAKSTLGDIFIYDQNQIHNRINVKWQVAPSLLFKVDFRNRLFWGDLSTQSMIDGLDTANDYFDLSIGKSNDKGLAYHAMIDRLYLEWIKGNWELRLGRQRINWGISTVWNPNDIFNAFSFTDFDYEERPGSDALRVRYYTGFASSVEVAAKMTDSIEAAVIAGMWRFNTGGYDFQVLGGLVENELALGGGWAGNIKGAGFKGEFTYFQPLEKKKSGSIAATIGVDYMTGKSLYLSSGFLFNSNGATDGSLASLFDFALSAKNLYPYKYSIFLQGGYPITPLLNGGLALIYSPSKVHATFLNPTITYSIAENWDIDLVGQIALEKEGKTFRSPIQAVFLRVKMSY
ncbi:MAG: hypothetical protein IPJ40_00825 [Saprospirales bacterium]|nr:hypothetical protein [Saprospirales bacterium]